MQNHNLTLITSMCLQVYRIHVYVKLSSKYIILRLVKFVLCFFNMLCKILLVPQFGITSNYIVHIDWTLLIIFRFEQKLSFLILRVLGKMSIK